MKFLSSFHSAPPAARVLQEPVLFGLPPLGRERPAPVAGETEAIARRRAAEMALDAGAQRQYATRDDAEVIERRRESAQHRP
jgi:hypothetical protein